MEEPQTQTQAPAPAPVIEGLEEHLPEWQVDMVYAWDDTSQQVVPSDPRVVDDLQRKGHFILGLTKAFRTKLGLLQNAVNGPLLEKRDTLVKQQAKIQARVDEVKMASGTIEQETKLSSDEIVERLKSTERFKLSLLLRDKVDLGKDIESIQGLIEEVAERGKASSMIDFLGKEKHLRDRCELLINKPFKEGIEVSADDFEHEARAYKDVVKKYRALQELIEVKDTIISQLLEDRALLQKKLEAAEAEHKKEMKDLEIENEKLLQSAQEEAETLPLTDRPEIVSTSVKTSSEPGDEQVHYSQGNAEGKASEGKGAWLMTIEHNGKKIEVYQDG